MRKINENKVKYVEAELNRRLIPTCKITVYDSEIICEVIHFVWKVDVITMDSETFISLSCEACVREMINKAKCKYLEMFFNREEE